MKKLLLVPLALAAVTAANLITTHYAKQGHPEVSVYTAFFLIGFDIVARDRLHDAYSGARRAAILVALIVGGSILSYVANPGSVEIAKWSAIAFAGAMAVDTITYFAAHRHPWLVRSNVSNIASAITDSALFCAGLGFPFIVAYGQFTAKVGGGLLFSLILARHHTRKVATA